MGAFRGGTAANVISDYVALDITVCANTENTRYRLLDSIKRVALNSARAAGVPEYLLPLVVSENSAPTTTNDSALSQRVRRAISVGMGDDAFVGWCQSDMGAKDFPDLVNMTLVIPSVYF